MNEQELKHYGVLGMKWGKRKAANTVNKSYTAKQRKNDRAFYGDRGEKRINKKLNEGYGLRGARHYEAERKAKNEKRKKIVKRGAKRAGKALASIGTYYMVDQVFYNGAGTKLAKAAFIQTGRKLTEVYLKARGSKGVTWL